MYNTTILDEVKAAEIAKQQKLSMDDAIQFASALSTNAEAITSLDKHFDNLKIPRVKPQ
ncbi:MAG: PIN domain-containing protein [Conexivisphaerales archaeon]